MTPEQIEQLEELVRLGEKAPSMSQMLDAQTAERMECHKSVTDKGIQMATVGHVAAAAKLQAIGDESKKFYEAAHWNIPILRALLDELKGKQDD